ncbi:MAG: insulinase family protein [Treponema sp.]|nr:insulinase family protein [Treponema sp.]
MVSEKKALVVGDVYKNFEVLTVEPLPELSAQGIWLRHKTLGMEIYHILNHDEENLFAFAFKTPPKDSTGVAHILEHSVLCGSKNYPLKDPFIRLVNQSVKTFLNAMTFSDKTVYPASSISRTDYFNLMGVYGDAVFFPLLEKWTFAQEAHRLELDSQGKPTIQGVVYNEMKGNYSSFENIAGDWAVRSVLPNTIYDLDSGGDPVEIPLLSYEDFVAFHRNHYNPGNCRLFLAGNISTQDQIDFLCQRFLDTYAQTIASLSVQQAEGEQTLSEQVCAGAQACADEGRKLLPLDTPPEAFAEPVVLEKIGPTANEDDGEQSEDSGANVTLTWFLGDSSDPVGHMESILLAEILMGHDGSPLCQALLESGLGEDLAPNNGLDSEMHWVLFTAGLRGCNRQDAQKVESVILSVLERLCIEGIPQEDIDAAVLAVDFAQREVRRVYGPYSLVLMRRCLRGWLYGRRPSETLLTRECFAKIKERIAQDPRYVQNLISQLLLQNKHRSRVTVYPHADYSQQRKAAEEALVARLMEGTSIEEVQANHQKLVEFQQEGSEKEDISILPHLSPQELPTDVDEITIKRQAGPNQVPVFVSQEATNGIVYAQLCFPVDLLEPEDYLFLPFLAGSLSNVGFGTTSWVEASRRSALETGGMGGNLFTSAMMNGLDNLMACNEHGEVVQDPVFGRDWLFFKVKMLTEQSEKAFILLQENFLTVDFSDSQRLSTLLKEFRNDFVASLAPNGNEYVASRSSCTLSRNKAIDELWNGLSQLAQIKFMMDMDIQQLGQKLSSLFTRIKEHGAIAQIIADEESLKIALPLLEKTIADCKLLPLKARVADNTQRFYELTQLPSSTLDGVVEASDGNQQEALLELLPSNFQVGFAAITCGGKGYDNPEYVYDGILAHWITNTALWEQIRTVGGAYGAFAWPDTSERIFGFATYRDPKPLRSLQVFQQVIAQAAEACLTQEELDGVITGCYSKEVQPKSPSSRGSVGFLRYLYGYTQEAKKKKLELLVQAKPENIRQAAQNLLASLEQYQRQAVIVNSNDVNADELKERKNIRQLNIIAENMR